MTSIASDDVMKRSKVWECSGCGAGCVLDTQNAQSTMPVQCPYGHSRRQWIPMAVVPTPPPKEVKRGVWYELTCIDCGKGQWVRVVDGKQETLLTPLPPEPKEETTALVTADECLRVIAAYQKERMEFIALNPDPEQHPLLEGLAEAAKAAAKALQILLSVPLYVHISGNDDADKTGE